MAGVRWKLAWAVFAAGLLGSAGLRAQPLDVDQGWQGPQIAAWYDLKQGSRMAPGSWFRALEVPGGTALFASDAHMGELRYLTRPGQLPVGFTADAQDDRKFGRTKLRWLKNQGPREPWVGMTCAACHTGELKRGTQVVRVQGAPTLADFQTMMRRFMRTLDETSAPGPNAKFDRFAARVLPSGATPQDKDRLREALVKFTADQRQSFDMNDKDGLNRLVLDYGFGRLDAVGHILNKVALTANPTAPTPNPPDAPVSYPFLWNIPQHTHVQWNGIATNSHPPLTLPSGRKVDLGALGRNTGEVIGVFADIQVKKRFLSLPPGYRSSVRARDLLDAEDLLTSLKPPKWPRAEFGYDSGKAVAGRALFVKHCIQCHGDLRRDDLTTRQRPAPVPGDDRLGPLTLEEMGFFKPQKANETKADTDRWMACNAVLDQASTGKLNGTFAAALPLKKFKPVDTNSKMLATMVIGVIVENLPEIATAAKTPTIKGSEAQPIVPEAAAIDPYAARRTACEAYASGPDYKDLAYKGRPLAGVWATGPFLHNGSVPSLWDLLQPPAQRPTSFFTGSREFDPRTVGFVQAQSAENSFRFRVRDDAGRIIEGNSNLGHDYGTGLSEAERWQIVEYLKAVGDPTL